MEAGGLRIGNLVDLGNRIAKVIEIGQVHCVVVDLEETQDTIEDYERIRSITLTEEWLLKFGFEINRQTKEENNIWRRNWEEGRFEVEQIGAGFFLWDNYCYGTKIKYVHQIQNLYFVLTGEELKTTRTMKTAVEKLIPSDAHSFEVFAIKDCDESTTGKQAFIGFKISNGDFHFIGVPYTETKQQEQ
jgi:hypothetical protein